MYFTEKQLKILKFIQRFRKEREIAPTMKEIAEKLGISKITVYGHLNQLERKGALKREKFRARSVELLVEPEDKREPGSLPLLGSIPAGPPAPGEPPGESLDLALVLPPWRSCCVYRVQGDSMIDDQIRDGDYVIVERRSNVQNGDTVVAALPDGRLTLKRFYQEKGRVRLQPANDTLKASYPSDVEIRGVVVSLLRNFHQAERN